MRHRKEHLDLRSAKEKAAAGKEGDATRAGEQNVKSDKAEKPPHMSESEYVNNVRGKTKMALRAASGNVAAVRKQIKANGGFAKTAKTLGPVGTILIVLAICMGGAMGTQGTMLGSLMGNFNLKMDNMNVMTNLRSKMLLKLQLRLNGKTDNVWGNFSKKQIKKLAQAGIEVGSDDDGTYLKYKNSDDTEVKVRADNFDSVYDTDNDFHTKYHDATATWRTSVAEWFDQGATNVLKFLGVDRGSLSKVKKSSDYDEVEQDFREKTEQEFEGKRGTMGIETDSDKAKTEVEDTDEDGKPITRPGYTTTEYEGEERVNAQSGKTSIEIGSDASEAKVRADLEAYAKAKMDSDGIDMSIVGSIANGGCQLYNTAVAINLMAQAYEAAQVVLMAMKIFEAIQRMQAGDGGADVIVDVIGTYLVTEKTKTFAFKDVLGKSAERTVTGSVMSSTPMGALFGGAQLSEGDPIVRSFTNSDNDFRSIMSAIDGPEGYQACLGVKAGAAIADMVGDVASLGFKKIADYLIGTAISVTIAMSVSLIVELMVPKILNIIQRDFEDLLIGPEASGGLLWGGEQIYAQNEQYTNFTVANKKKLMEFNAAKQEVIADYARYDRNNLSPFDTSSPYTFMGAIMQTFGSILLNNHSALIMANGLTMAVGKSLVAMTPAASAASSVDDLVSLGTCRELSTLMMTGIGWNEDERLYGSAFCTPRFVGDLTYLSTPVDELEDAANSRGWFDDYQEDGSGYTIKENEYMAQMQREYGLRSTPLGQIDSGICQQFSILDTGNTFIDSVLGAAPVLGGFIDIVNAAVTEGGIDRCTGKEYLKDNTENRLVRQLSVDARIGVASGIINESPIDAYVDKYFEEHPLDNSLNGIVARKLGITTEQLEVALGQIEGLYIALNYDWHGRGPIVQEEVKHEKIQIENDGKVTYVIASLPIFQDISFVKRSDFSA